MNRKISPVRIAVLFCLLIVASTGRSQSAYKIVGIGFYNLENLFHPTDDPLIDDEEFTPQGANSYTEAIYREKLANLSDVISRMGTSTTPDGMAVVGVCEIENRLVLEDLVAQESLAGRKYEIVHYDSRDSRGIDVALLYQPTYFRYDSSLSIAMPAYVSGGDTSYSRDILVVYGRLDGEPFAFLVNHWPSRRGGERATAHLRNAAAKLNKEVVDRNTAAGIKTIVMGDLNDDPVNVSVREILRAKPKPDRLAPTDMYNPMYDFYKRGIGTTAYQDAWSLFDQVILSSNLVGDIAGFRYYRAEVFNEPFLAQKLGRFKGYPFRTYAGNTYLGGYSDHFPVYVFLVKKR